MTKPLISALGLGFSYDRPVLVDLDLDVRAGSITTLVGLNGAGKTTVLRLLSGQLKPAEGQVRIIQEDPQRARARRRLFFIPEETDLPGHLNARETLRFFAALYGGPRLSGQRVRDLLAEVGLEGVAGRRATTFSKGMRRRLELGCLLSVNVPVWILDEPQSGLDPEGLALLVRLCLRAKDQGSAVVMATHDLAHVRALADQVVLLRSGRCIFKGDQEALVERTGVRSFEVAGGGHELDVGIAELVQRCGAQVSGPDMASSSVERLLTGDQDASAKP